MSHLARIICSGCIYHDKNCLGSFKPFSQTHTYPPKLNKQKSHKKNIIGTNLLEKEQVQTKQQEKKSQSTSHSQPNANITVHK